jgi:phytanoyl-CoA hydroxylase
VTRVPALTVPYRLRVQLNEARSRIERGVRRAVFGGQPSWRRRPNVLPWFDRPDALERIDRSRPDAALLERWVRDGWVVVDGCVDERDVDEMIAVLDGLWDAPAAIPDLRLLGLRETLDGEQRDLFHEDVLRLEPERRRRIRDASDWRIHGFHYVNDAARRIYDDRRLGGLASRLFGRRARPIAAINFMTGSEQALHQDMAVFHIWPQNFLIGAWIACEEIAHDSGPLVLHSGSHRAPFFPGFTDYPQTNLRTADPVTARRYQQWIEDLATGFERVEFRGRKGQVLFWHGMLFHGGAPIRRRGTSRKSMVIHYTVRGADRGREVVGPFNW